MPETGFYHEINNSLGIIRGQCELFLLNARDGFYDAKTKEEILQMASDTLRGVIHETDRIVSTLKKFKKEGGV
ncbi:MAG: hypothetical protein HY593_01220 [Candidatus Omnitrophica bacterium]|nr:hypothetical protein [Candidatus Omnitrophota bacterium]